MKRTLLAMIAMLLLAAPALSATVVVIETNYGDITVELNEEKAQGYQGLHDPGREFFPGDGAEKNPTTD